MADITKQPAAVADTGCVYETSGFTTNVVYIGRYNSSLEHTFYRFPNVTIPQGATISAAKVQLHAEGSYTNTISSRIYANDADNATAPTTKAQFDGKTLTDAYADWTFGNWTSGSWYDSPSIVDIVQEVVNRASWASGNAILILQKSTISASGSDLEREITAYNVDAGDSPKLVITYVTSQNYTKTITVTANASATNTKQVSKNVTSTANASSSNAKSIGKNVTATANASSVATKSVGKVITAVANASSTLVKTVSKYITAVADASANLAYVPTLLYDKAVTAVANASASVTKVVIKYVSAVAQGSASNSKIISKYMSAVANASALATKSVSKYISTVANASATLTAEAISIVEQGITTVANATVSVTKIVNKAITTVASVSASVAKSVSKAVSTVAQASSNTTKKAQKSIIATANSTASLGASQQQSGAWISLGVTESATLSHTFAANFFGNDKEYEWRVRSYDSAHEAWYDWSDVATFNTINPPVLSTMSIEQDDAIDVGIIDITAVITSIYDRQCTLTVYVADNAQFTSATSDATILDDSGETFSVSGIFPRAGLMYVKFVAEDSTGLQSETIITVDVTRTIYFISEPSINLQAPQATHVTVRVKDSSPVVEYTAHITPEASTSNMIERLVEIDDGDATVCQTVAEQLISRWGREQKSISGDINLTVTLSFKERIHIVDGQSGIDDEFILQEKQHDVTGMVTKITVGDIVLDDSELLARILDKLK